MGDPLSEDGVGGVLHVRVDGMPVSGKGGEQDQVRLGDRAARGYDLLAYLKIFPIALLHGFLLLQCADIRDDPDIPALMILRLPGDL
jgi:hypothetical protein